MPHTLSLRPLPFWHPLLLGAWALFFWAQPIGAQNTADGLYWQGKKIAPLDTLFERCLANNDLMRTQEVLVRIRQEELDIERKGLLRHISIGGSMDVGNSSLNSVGSDGIAPTTTALQRQTFQYLAGVSVSLPLSSIATRKNTLAIRNLEVQRSRYEMGTHELALRQELITRYHALKEALMLRDINAEQAELSRLTYTNADRLFREGQLDIDQYTKATEAYFEAVRRVELSKVAAENAFLLLQAFVGTSLLED